MRAFQHVQDNQYCIFKQTNNCNQIDKKNKIKIKKNPKVLFIERNYKVKNDFPKSFKNITF